MNDMSGRDPRAVDAPLEIERIERGDGLLLRLSGELDNSNGHRVEEELHGVDGFVAFDTGGLTFVDSRGLMTLIVSRDKVGADRFELFVAPDGPVDRLITLTGLTDEFNITRGPAEPPH